MKIYYNKTEIKRKELVKAISEITGKGSKYLGTPTLSYQVGIYEITRDCALCCPDELDEVPEFREKNNYLIEELSKRGFEKENFTVTTISMPAEKINLENFRNLLEAKGDLIKKALGIKSIDIDENSNIVNFDWPESLTRDQFNAYAKFIEAICKMSLAQGKISNKVKEYVNEKYAFRCFLLRLGFIGDEYKTDRRILLSKLEGSSAYKYGGPRI